MGRTKKDLHAEPVGDRLEPASDEQSEAMAGDLILFGSRTQFLQDLNNRYRDGLSYDQETIEHECRRLIDIADKAILETGRRLILLKEHTEKGKFQESLGRIGIQIRTAQRYMQITLRLDDPKRHAIAKLGQKKAAELLVFDDDNLDELGEGGTVHGLELTAIEKMSVRELHNKVAELTKKTEQQQERYENAIAKQDKKIHELEYSASRVHEWDEIATSLKHDITQASGKLIEHCSALRKLVDCTLQEAQERDLSDAQVASVIEHFDGVLKNINEHLADLNAEFDTEMSGYLNLPRTAWTSSDEPHQG